MEADGEKSRAEFEVMRAAMESARAEAENERARSAEQLHSDAESRANASEELLKLAKEALAEVEVQLGELKAAKENADSEAFAAFEAGKSATYTEYKTALKDSRMRDKKASYLLYQGTGVSSFEKISAAATSKEAWSILRNSHCGIEKTMRRYGERMESLQVIKKIFRSLSPKFKHVVVAIEESKDLSAMTTDELMAHLRDDRNEQGGTSQKSRERSRGYNNRSSGFRGRGRRGPRRGGISQPHFAPRRRARDRGGGYNNRPGFDKSNVQCYQCHKFEHYSNECQSRATTEAGEQANFFEQETNKSGPTILFVHHGDTENQNNVWYLDLGASNHMYGKKELFVELDETVQAQVSFGDSSKTPVRGRGNIMIKLKNGDHDYISNVYYVPAMKNNILSMGQLLEKGYDISMKDCHLTIKDNHYYKNR
ncbi:uncharacterized protein LOC114259031 [Camellia sinensis]|uniref:uncharacterized protein LOC114259031 n=1 Tax=Camellia sinensis TaxID=4442 RepID=UPI001036ECF9|nr:uncharacterized protein LOC114259031 [Camellia sinensis]